MLEWTSTGFYVFLLLAVWIRKELNLFFLAKSDPKVVALAAVSKVAQPFIINGDARGKTVFNWFIEKI